MPRVSIITIFYNEERFLSEAVDSVIAQTYDDWELLLVDDGSTDGSSAIAQAFAQTHPDKIRYLDHEGHANKGMSATRNLGIESAQGELITFLDADDTWTNRKLETQVALLDEFPDVGFVTAPAYWWHSWTGNADDEALEFYQDLGVPLDEVAAPGVILAAYLRNDCSSLCDVMVRTSAIDKVGGYVDSFEGMYEDQVFHAKLSLHFAAYVSSHVFYKYRQHPDSCVHNTDKKSYARIRSQFLDWLESYDNGVVAQSPDINALLRRELLVNRNPIVGPIIRVKRWAQDALGAAAMGFARIVLPQKLRHALYFHKAHHPMPPVHCIRFGSFNRVTPFSRMFGFDRGTAVDRYYIEAFLETCASDVKGHVLEVGDNTYTRRMGGDKVTSSDILHSNIGVPGPAATVLGDFATGEGIPEEAFDCVIVTQTLLFIYDVESAVRTLYRSLKPGGVLLLTVPGITPIIRDDADVWGQYWSFTSASTRKLLTNNFPEENVELTSYGNVKSATAFLYGMAHEELRKSDLDFQDRDYEVIICARAQKPLQ